MKKLLFAVLALAAAPVQAGFMPITTPYVVQEHIDLNPEIWEYERPLRAVIHHTEPKPCEGQSNCVQVDAILEGADGRTYTPSGTEEGAMAWDPSFVYYLTTLRIQCNKPSTRFRINYVHNVRTWNHDPVTGNRTTSRTDQYSFYTVSTYRFQKDMCRTLLSPERRAAVDTLNTVACILDPKYCKD